MPAAGLLVLWRVFELCNLACQFCGYPGRSPREVHVFSFSPVATVEVGRPHGPTPVHRRRTGP
jgi:hypothetical protein